MTWTHHEPLDEPRDQRSEDPLDREIRQALTELPRERAADEFTAQVLHRLDDSLRQPWRQAARQRVDRPRWQPVLAGAALAAAALGVGLLSVGSFRPPEESAVDETSAPGPAVAEARGESTDPSALERLPVQEVVFDAEAASGHDSVALLDELRREHRRLERDLRDLRELAEGSRVLYIGGDESLDFVLDLSSEPAPGGGGAVRPAALQRRGSGGGPRFF